MSAGYCAVEICTRGAVSELFEGIELGDHELRIGGGVASDEDERHVGCAIQRLALIPIGSAVNQIDRVDSCCRSVRVHVAERDVHADRAEEESSHHNDTDD